MASCGLHDGEAKPYGTPPSNFASFSSLNTPSSSSSDISSTSPSLQLNHNTSISNSVGFEMAGLSKNLSSLSFIPVAAADANYGESSGPNKRPHLEKPVVPKTRRKNKGVKKANTKAVDPSPIVEMYNESFEKYDSSIFIRKILMDNKVDIS